jgi:prepilin-type N-terminal cleavage/methylation domain-containing protein
MGIRIGINKYEAKLIVSNHFTKTQGFTLLEIMIVVAIIGSILAIAIPNLVKSRTLAQYNICVANLSKIEAAKQIFGAENGKINGDPVDDIDLIGPELYLAEMPECPAGGTYTINPIGTVCVCTIDGHKID